MADSHGAKVVVTADASPFVKGMNTAKRQMKDFEKVSSDVSGKFAGFFGVNTDQVEKLSNAMKGLGNKLNETGDAGKMAFGRIVTAASGVTAALGAISVAGLVTAFKALNDEAETFMNTVQGSHIQAQTNAYKDTFKQVLADSREELGKLAAEAKQNGEIAGVGFWQSFTHYIKSGAFGASVTLPGDAAVVNQQVFDQLKGSISDANEKAREGMELAKELNDIEIETAYNEKALVELRTQQLEAMGRVRDMSKSVNERRKAAKDYEDSIDKIYELQYGTMSRMVTAKIKLDGLASSSKETTIEDYRLEAQLAQLEAERQQSKNALLRYMNAINKGEKQSVADAKEVNSELEITRALMASLAGNSLLDIKVNPIDSKVISDLKPTIDVKPQVSNWAEFFKDVDSGFLEQFGDGLTIGVALDIQDDQLIDLSNQLKSTIGDLSMSIGESLGTLVGDLVNGEGAWQNFANMAISSFGDMAIQVGKIAIEAGIATLGIKAALESLNPYLAIAAGTALVALGYAVKTSLANVASGSYSSSAVASSTGSSYSSSTNYGTSELTVNVTGTLVGEGSNLIAVINNTNKKSNHTT